MLAGVGGIVIAADVEPGPSIESAALDVGDVVGHQIVAIGVAFVNGRPDFAGVGVDRQAHGVANAGRVDAHELAFGRVFQNIGAMVFVRSVAVIGGRADCQEQALAVLRKNDIASRVATARGNIGDQRFGHAGRFEVAVLVGVADQRAGVADV